MKKKFAIGLGIGALFLYLALRQVDFAACASSLASARWEWIAIACAIYVCAFILRSFRWQVLLAPMQRVPVARLFNLLLLGFFMNNLLPMRIGELVRAHITGQKTGLSRSSAFATIVVERLFDGLAYVVLFAVTILFLPFPAWTKKTFATGAVLFCGVLLALYFLARNQEKALTLFARVPCPERFKAGLQDILGNFLKGLQVLGSPLHLSRVFALSLAVWCVEGSVYLLCAQAFSLDLNFFQCLLVMTIIGTGAILPPAPGYVGTVEFLGLTSLMFLGIERNQAFGYIITVHLLQLVTISALGVFGLLREKVTFSDLIRIEKQSKI